MHFSLLPCVLHTPAHLILDLIALIICGEAYNLWRSLFENYVCKIWFKWCSLLQWRCCTSSMYRMSLSWTKFLYRNIFASIRFLLVSTPIHRRRHAQQNQTCNVPFQGLNWTSKLSVILLLLCSLHVYWATDLRYKWKKRTSNVIDGLTLVDKYIIVINILNALLVLIIVLTDMYSLCFKTAQNSTTIWLWIFVFSVKIITFNLL
jgi:hypothetical protein